MPNYRTVSFVFVFVLVFIVGAAVLPATVAAQINGKKTGGESKQPARRDSRVENALIQIGIAYTVMPTGSFSVTYNYTDVRRRQECYISSVVERYGNLEVREVWSRARRERGALPAGVANRLLRVTNKFGGWRIADADDGSGVVVYYSAQVAADADAATLKTVTGLVAVVADEMEAELTGADDN